MQTLELKKNDIELEQPLVTIITITYNLIENGRKETFLQAVESVKNQTYKNIEHIVIDGASTDGTIELIESTGLKYYSEPDKGIYDAFNKGVLKAGGKYINFLNSDDFFNNPNAVKLSVEALEKNKAAFSFAAANILGENDVLSQVFEPKIYNIYLRMPFCHQTMFTSVDAIKKEGMFDLNFSSAADMDLILRLCLKNYKFVEVKENIISFRYTGISKKAIGVSLQEQIGILKKNYSKYINASDKEYEKIFVGYYLPFKLLIKLKMPHLKTFLYWLRKSLNIYRKQIIWFRTANGKLILLSIFGHFIIGSEDEMFKVDAILKKCK